VNFDRRYTQSNRYGGFTKTQDDAILKVVSHAKNQTEFSNTLASDTEL